MTDVYDIDLAELSFGELCVLQERIEGEFKRRQFPDSNPNAQLNASKRVARIAFELRLQSQLLRSICRDLKEPKR